MKNILSNTPTKIFRSVCTSNVYPRLPMALCLVLCMLGLGLSVNASGTTTTITTFDAPGAGRSWDLTQTISADVTATCVLLAARSPRSMLRTRAQDLFPRGHSPQTSLQWALTQQARSSDSTLTRAQYSTASCALLTASSPNSIPLARYSPTPTPSTLWA